MSREPRIALLYGGTSDEREVSIGSGLAAAAALEKRFQVDRFDIVSEAALPEGLDPERHVVFSTLHGTFGEDGGIQRLMDARGVVYAGCDADSSALTFDKVATKAKMAEAGVPVAGQVAFDLPHVPSPEAIVAALGESVVLKPVCQGSSVGLAFACGVEAIGRALAALEYDRWLVEPRIVGREATVGILHGQALEIVEVRPRSGTYDYQSKYTKGATEYIAPAPFGEEVTAAAKAYAVRAFEACGCRDYGRIDFLVGAAGELTFLEVNTLPGLKETSLLPMSARASGYDFDQLLFKLVESALNRYRNRYSVR